MSSRRALFGTQSEFVKGKWRSELVYALLERESHDSPV
jgi:hypothetical protein